MQIQLTQIWDGDPRGEAPSLLMQGTWGGGIEEWRGGGVEV